MRAKISKSSVILVQPPQDNQRASLLTQTELKEYLSPSTHKPHLPTLRMSHLEKGMLLSYFIDHQVHLTNKEEQNKIFEDAGYMMESHKYARRKPNMETCDLFCKTILTTALGRSARIKKYFMIYSTKTGVLSRTQREAYVPRLPH